MPRRSVAVEVDGKTKEELLMLAGSEDKDVAFRAKIILACIEEKETKKAALIAGTSATNADKWKRKFIKEGIQAIRSAKPASGGRPTGNKRPEDLREKIQSYIDDHAETWSAQNIAESLSVSQNCIYYELSRMGITPNQRTRCWNYPTQDIYSYGCFALIGIYLSKDAGFVVTAEVNQPFDHDEMHGEVITYNSDLNALLMKAESSMSLADTIVSLKYLDSPDTSQKTADVAEFYAELMADWRDEDVKEFRVYMFSDQPVKAFEEIEDPRIIVEKEHSVVEMIGKLFIVSSNTKKMDTCIQAAINALSNYYEAHAEVSEPYAWRLLPQRHEITREEALPVIAAVNETNQKSVVKAILQYIDEDGTIQSIEVKPDEDLPVLTADDMKTREGFENYLNQLDQVMGGFTRSFNEKSRSFCLDNLKKN